MAGRIVASAVRQAAAPGAAINAPALGLYRRRRPDQTLAYQIVHDWLATWLAQQDDQDRSVPAVVERELTSFLECGILAHGFARARCPDCTAEFLVAFSCKGRGICPSCTTKRMVATAAHLVDAVIPRVPMRQWVLSLPKRLRPALRADPILATRVLRIFTDCIERRLHDSCAAPAVARPGAVSFLQRFGSALNEHWHYHVCVSDGVFTDASAGPVEFVPALIDSPVDSAAVQARVRRRVLAAYRRRGWLNADAAANMAQWEHGGGFSVDASVAIHGNDRAGLERLLRYCARPCWASERLARASDGERLIVTLPKPARDGRCKVILTPLELIDRLVRFIPAPRRHLHRYHGALAPHCALRARVVARAGRAMAPSTSDDLAPRIGRGLCVFAQASQAPLEPVSVAPPKPAHRRG